MLRLPAALVPLLVLATLSCSGSTPPPEEPEHETPRLGGKKDVNDFQADMEMEGFEPAEEATDEAGGTDEVASEEQEEAPQATSAPEPAAETASEVAREPAGPSRPPSEMLTAPKISFMINWPSSAPKDSIEAKCKKDAGDDMAAFAKCRSDARKEFLADVILFKKEGDRLWWYVYRRDRGTLFEVSKSQVQIASETKNTVTLRMLGGSGARPLFVQAKEVTVSVPNDSSIELADPRYGRLVYEAKIGLVGG